MWDGLRDVVWCIIVCASFVWLVVRVSVLIVMYCVLLYVLLLCSFVCALFECYCGV